MKREFLRLAWKTITSWRRSTPEPPPRPGSDNQFKTWPRIRLTDINPQAQQDKDERTWDP